ncbi:MAG: murein transglycosylase, partial [Pseudomonadota bacterium]
MGRRLVKLAAFILSAAMPHLSMAAEPTYRLLTFEDLDGWADDDHASALEVFLETCPDLKDPEWAKVCAVSTQSPDPRRFF